MKQRWITLASVAICVVLAIGGCRDDEVEGAARGGDYSVCAAPPLNNQVVVCDSVLRSVEDYCGFSLTVDVCLCADEIVDCVTEGGWLQSILDCEDSSGDCATYIGCLELVGESPVEGCDSPNEWGCITTLGSEDDTDE